jgi:hypothetical protein
MIQNYDVTVVKGDTARWSYFFPGVTSGNTFNFIGCTLYMQVRTGYSPEPLVATYATNIISNTNLFYPAGITGGISAATGGTVYMCLGSSYSNSLTTDRICKYDLKVYEPNLKDLITLIQGNIQVLPEVTDI